MHFLPDELQKAKDFHSHLGPYLVVGLKMGQTISRRLGQEPFPMTITSLTGLKPPLSCVIDGLQMATPCTVGNGGIVIQNDGQAMIRVAKGSRELEISLKPTVHDEIRAVVGTDRMEELALRLWGSEDSELLDVSEFEIRDERLETREKPGSGDRESL
jgi:formylmethanofuran dehydrogenase subunit E